MTTKKKAKAAPDINELTRLPEIYFNGFMNSVGVSDVTIRLKVGEEEVAVLHCSHNIGKTLAVKMNELIQSYELATGDTVRTTDELALIHSS